MIETKKYVRKTFEVEAVQVTSKNMFEVAEWCHGEILTEDGNDYVKVSVARVLNDRQTQAFINDWVLKAGNGFKVYTPKAFSKSFEPLYADVTDKKQPVIAVG